MGNYTILKYSKILGETGKEEILQFYKCSQKSSSEHWDIFWKLTLGAPDILPVPYQMNTDCSKDAINFNPRLSQILCKVFFSKNMQLEP